jgi:hypothetical protein
MSDDLTVLQTLKVRGITFGNPGTLKIIEFDDKEITQQLQRQ